MRSSLRNLRACFVVCAVFAVFSVPALSFAAALPATRDLVVQPGESATLEIPVANPESAEQVFSLSLLSASFLQGVDQPQLQALLPSISPWVSVSDTSVTVPSGSSVPVILTVRPPANVTSQTFVLALVASETLSGEISVVHGTATLVFVNIGDDAPRGSCVSFVQITDDLAHLSLTNDGRGILYDNGAIVLRGMFGIQLGTSSSNPLFHRVLSGQARSWDVSLPVVPWWAIGPLSYGVSDGQLDASACSDIQIPGRWWPIAGAGILVLSVVAAFVRRRIS